MKELERRWQDFKDALWEAREGPVTDGDRALALLAMAVIGWFAGWAILEYAMGLIVGGIIVWLFTRSRQTVGEVEPWVVEDWIRGAHQGHEADFPEWLRVPFDICDQQICEEGRAVLKEMRRG